MAIEWSAKAYSPGGYARPRLLAVGNRRILTGGVIGSSEAFTASVLDAGVIPVGHRPANVVRAAGASLQGSMMCQVNSNGTISLVWWASVSMGANAYAATSTLEWTV